MITRDEVIWLYRCLFGREPDDEGAIIEHQKQPSFEAARKALMRSAEFRIRASIEPIHDMKYRSSFSPISIAVTSIVKNEEARISTMIESVLPISDMVVLVDTGSTDATVKVATSFLARTAHLTKTIPFKDFAQARNAAIALVPESIDWILMLDADEYIVREDYARIFDLVRRQDVDAWKLPRYNFVDADGTKPVVVYPDYQGRLFRNRIDDPIRYRGKAHEVLENVRMWGTAPMNSAEIGGPHIHHSGAVNQSRERWQEKHDFYKSLLSPEI